MHGALWNWLSTRDAIVFALSCFGEEEICWRQSGERFLLTSTMVAGDVFAWFPMGVVLLPNFCPSFLISQAEVDLLS